jgi:LmbE family N-acetylglucosaminyl deacetylase
MTEPPVEREREREVSAAAAERDIIIAVTNTRLLLPPRGERDRDAAAADTSGTFEKWMRRIISKSLAHVMRTPAAQQQHPQHQPDWQLFGIVLNC